MILVAGFLILIFGSFNPNVYFGLVTSLVIAFALIADLVVLPAMLVAGSPRN